MMLSVSVRPASPTVRASISAGARVHVIPNRLQPDHTLSALPLCAGKIVNMSTPLIHPHLGVPYYQFWQRSNDRELPVERCILYSLPCANVTRPFREAVCFPLWYLHEKLNGSFSSALFQTRPEPKGPTGVSTNNILLVHVYISGMLWRILVGAMIEALLMSELGMLWLAAKPDSTSQLELCTKLVTGFVDRYCSIRRCVLLSEKSCLCTLLDLT